jgi:hypothetical protein
MKLHIGTTRLVVLQGDYAYKIARFRPLKLLIRCFSALRSQRKRLLYREKIEVEHHASYIRGAWEYLCAGYYANWREWHRWQETKDPRYVPAIKITCKGLILVQLRGVAVDTRVAESHFPEFVGKENHELGGVHQYVALSDGTVRIADYASLI